MRVLIQGFALPRALPYMLAASSTSTFVRHTNLMHVSVPPSADEPVEYKEFVWTHPELRPFGRHLPANCPSCGVLESFGKPIKLTPGDAATTYVFVCNGYDINASLCGHELQVKPMEGFEPFGQAQNKARWMVKTSTVVI